MRKVFNKALAGVTSATLIATLAFLSLSQLANVSLPTLTDLIYPVLPGSSGLYCPPCVNDHTVSTAVASSALTVLVKLTENGQRQRK